MNIQRGILSFISVLSGLGLVAMLIAPALAPSQIDIEGPEGSGSFGANVTVLPNGNIVVCDPYYDDGGTADVGAVYLYDGASAALISMLTGSTAGDQVGNWGVTGLSNGNYVVSSPYWDNEGVADAGAITWGDGMSGITGTVSADNSLVGSAAGDQVGIWGISTLSNGNYVVRSPSWDNEGVVDAGAVTWGDEESGVTGVVSAANSLVGSTAGDQVGIWGISTLSNGNYVVRSQWWNNSTGAVTWGDGESGVTGVVSAANSLVGSIAGDQVGVGGVTALSNGNYVVRSYYWNNGTATDAGAVTWGDGMSGITGTVSVDNSLVGSTSDDQVGNGGVYALENGNYVVRSPFWDNEGVANAGAVTWGDGTSGITGVVSAANSLVGSIAGDQVGVGGVTALSNGNYVVRSYYWNNGTATDAGAVTWGDGASGISGVVSAANSLVGSTTNDQVGFGGVSALSNGNYVVSSYGWDNAGILDAGAVTWGDGTSGITGVVSAANSLVGSTADDYVGDYGVTALNNGNYVVSSPFWDDLGITNVGAVTWGDGASGISGVVSAANSLVGSTAYDYVGIWVTALSNGNYVVRSQYWDNGGLADVGAVTWGDGASGITGVVSDANSLVGSTAGDQIGSGGVYVLSNGNYVVSSPYWDNEGVVDAGEVTWGDGMSGITGVVSADNSLVGSTAGDNVGDWGISTLSNGNYVVRSPYWDNEGVVDAGAVTWGDGMSGITGVVSAANSLVGSTASDQVGWGGVYALENGNYVVSSPLWDNEGVFDAGAVTWGDGMSGITGVVSAANSLVGTTAGDQVGAGGVTALSNGNYMVYSAFWDNGVFVNAGAVTWGDVNTPATGPITADNSVRGEAANGGLSLDFAYDEVNQQLVVGRPSDNIVTLFRPNRVPVADAGPDQSVLSNASVTLDGSASYDPDGNLPLAFDWEQSGGTPVSLSGSDTANPNFTAPTVLETSTLTFTLVVSDSLGLASLPDEVVITVEPYAALLPMVLK
jgi:hypothetical protein